MDLKLICVSLVGLGIGSLLCSLRPSLALCKDSRQDPGWKVLSWLIVFFIAGYSYFAWHLLHNPMSFIALVVSLILFLGSFFVVLVIKLCSRSIEHATHLTALAQHHAVHDDLTGLPNRKFLHRRIREVLKPDDIKQVSAAVLLMDMDRFKEVNDTLGHHIGDQLLQQVAPRLHDSIRDSDTVARLGGDEFAAVLPNADTVTAVAVTKRILDVMEAPFNVEQHTLTTGLSIGISMYPQHGDNQDTLLRHADIAMYLAKRKGSGFVLYDQSQDKYTLNRLKLSSKLKETINQGGLEMYYQPVIDVANSRFCGLEALARWHPGNNEIIPATEFIPLAENTGLIHKLTHWGLRTAISQTAEWHRMGIDCLMAVNLSIKDLQNPDFTKIVEGLLEEWMVLPENLILEVTESSVMTDHNQVELTLAQLDNLGIQIAIDDFGTGYSSLYRLKKMPISVIKIDRSFILDLSEDKNDAVIVHSTINLAHNMGKKVVAEGVESPEVLEILRNLHCDFAQGFNMALPLPADEVPVWLEHYGTGQPTIERRLNG